MTGIRISQAHMHGRFGEQISCGFGLCLLPGPANISRPGLQLTTVDLETGEVGQWQTIWNGTGGEVSHLPYNASWWR